MKPLQRYRGLIFDCDGVLFDSHPANLAYYNTVLEQLGEAPVTADDRERAQLCHTACSRDVFKVLLGDARVAEALELAGALDYRQFLPYLQPFDGMLETLPRLARQLPLALATNRTDSVHVLLEHFGIRHCFRTVVTSSDVVRPKPSPEMLQLASRRLELPVSDLLFVGDAPSDRQAAGEAGCAFVAFGDGLADVARIAGWEELAGWLPAGG